MTHREENIVNISMSAALLLKDGRIDLDDQGGFVGLTDYVISLAEKFEKEYAGVDWHSEDRDYWIEIDDFAEKELIERYGCEREARDQEASLSTDALPEDPVKVYAVAGSVKNEIFSGNLDECKAFCEENQWSWVDENRFHWDLEIEDSRDVLLPEGYFDALSYYSDKVGRDIEGEFTRVNADKLVFCYHNELEIIDFDFWARYETLCGEDLTYDEYKVADASYDGDPHEIGDEEFETIDAIKRSVRDYRSTMALIENTADLDQQIQAARTQGGETAMGVTAKNDRSDR